MRWEYLGMAGLLSNKPVVFLVLGRRNSLFFRCLICPLPLLDYSTQLFVSLPPIPLPCAHVLTCWWLVVTLHNAKIIWTWAFHATRNRLLWIVNCITIMSDEEECVAARPCPLPFWSSYNLRSTFAVQCCIRTTQRKKKIKVPKNVSTRQPSQSKCTSILQNPPWALDHYMIGAAAIRSLNSVETIYRGVLALCCAVWEIFLEPPRPDNCVYVCITRIHIFPALRCSCTRSQLFRFRH